MFEDVGKKIKVLAKVYTFIGIAFSVILGIVLIVRAIDYEMGGLFLLALIVMGLGSLFSWISSLVFYAFGELVENISVIDYRLSVAVKKEEEYTNKTITAINTNTAKLITTIEENQK